MLKEKKLIIFMPSIEGGGVEKNLFIISDYLAQKINHVSIITVSNTFKNKFNKNIKFISLKSNFWNKIGRRKKFIVCLFILLIEILKDRNQFVLCFQGNIYCTLLCKFLGIKIIVRSNSAPDGWSQNIIKYFFFKYIFSFANKIIVNSYEFKKKFKNKFNLQTICIYNPLNKNDIIKKSKIKCNIKFSKKKLNIINVARFTDQKDQITLLKSVNLIKNKINFRLLIVGRGVEKKKLMNYINLNKLRKKVKLINFTKNPFNLIRSSDLFILTSIYEGLPNVLLEALTLKKFVISTSCPTGPREILLNGRAGNLFKVGDYEKLSKLITQYKKNGNNELKKIELGYRNLDRFDFHKNLKKYLIIIKKFLY
jgi:glycosyltransferase involved in cell wall biosynthesis